MNFRISPVFIVSIATAFTILSACKPLQGGKRRECVLVFGASSVVTPLAELKTVFEQRYDTCVRLSFASSSVLAKQIEAGAEVDIFLSANRVWADFLKNKRSAFEYESFLSNRLVVVRSINERHVSELSEGGSSEKTLAEIVKGKRVAMGDYRHVPAGMYWHDVLRKMNLWQELKGRAILTASVRAAYYLALRNEADIALVYGTDVSDSQMEVLWTSPVGIPSPSIEYPFLRMSTRKEGKVFFDFLVSSEAKKIFMKHGFVVR